MISLTLVVNLIMLHSLSVQENTTVNKILFYIPKGIIGLMVYVSFFIYVYTEGLDTIVKQFARAGW